MARRSQFRCAPTAAGAGVLVLAGCAAWDLGPRLVRTDLPALPAAATHDYDPRPGMAHAALPVFDPGRGAFVGDGRIWLKGSAASRIARIGGREQPIALDPPYYTAMVCAPPGPTTVLFEQDGVPPRPVTVTVPDPARLNATDVAWSALFFGDFQPFAIAGDRVVVNAGEPLADGRGGERPGTLVAIRRLFQAAAEGRLPGLPPPAFACGVGDQIYVEGDYHDYRRSGVQHPMSAWSVEEQPRPRVPLGALPGFLDACYRGHWSFAPFERALQAIPALMTWDDHDIRDGWGSHGDEHVYRDTWFAEFRRACLAHQFQRGPRPLDADVARIDAPLWQALVVHGVPMFVLDLRTCRDVAVPTVLGDEQWQALRQWFAALDPARNRHYVLVSSVPLFYRIGRFANVAAQFTAEVRDDLLDTWTSPPNEPEWRRLVAEIVAAGRRGLRGVVVSGDFHVNSVCRVTAADGGEAAVLAYEVMAAGLAADDYSDWQQRVARDGWLLATPFDVAGARLATEFAFAEAAPSFLGLDLADGGFAASLLLATRRGLARLRLPLSWDPGAEPLAALLRRSRQPIDLPPAAR